jgi:hypothetical protein
MMPKSINFKTLGQQKYSRILPDSAMLHPGNKHASESQTVGGFVILGEGKELCKVLTKPGQFAVIEC